MAMKANLQQHLVPSRSPQFSMGLQRGQCSAPAREKSHSVPPHGHKGAGLSLYLQALISIGRGNHPV